MKKIALAGDRGPLRQNMPPCTEVTKLTLSRSSVFMFSVTALGEPACSPLSTGVLYPFINGCTGRPIVTSGTFAFYVAIRDHLPNGVRRLLEVDMVVTDPAGSPDGSC
jgi:hypothetical protein